MRIGLLSDTHIPEAATELPAEVHAAFEGCAAILHGGDLHRLDVLDDLQRIAPTLASRGNGDPLEPRDGRPGVPSDPRVAETFVVEAAGLRIGLTHDLEHLEDRPDGVVSALLATRFGGPVDIAVCGHTHVPMVWGLADGTAIVNPGSPTLPYGYRDVLGTIGLIDLADDGFVITVVALATGAVELELAGPAPRPCSRRAAPGRRPVTLPRTAFFHVSCRSMTVESRPSSGART